jgi:DNA-binding SARP family transcriptional activator
MSIHLSEPRITDLGVQIGVLGAFHIQVGGKSQPEQSRQVGRVGTILAGWPGELIERDRIVAGIWGESVPKTVANTLQVHISHLRRSAGKNTVRCHGTSYMLNLLPEAIDAQQFVDAIADAARMRRRNHHARAVELLTYATNLWRGTPFPDVLDPDLEARRARLTELRDQAREDLLESRLELCRDAYELGDIVADAMELVSRNPLRERGHVILVRALAAADRPGEASAAFEEAARQLRESIGLDPGRHLVETHTCALQRDPVILPRAMRSISIVPERVLTSMDAQGVADRVRETVVDMGAQLVTVVEPDSKRAEIIATAIGQTLHLDAPLGVFVLDHTQLTIANLSAILATASGDSELNVSDFPDLAGVMLVVTGTSAAMRKRMKSMFRWTYQPTVVVICEEPLAFDAEVVLGSADESTLEHRKGA